MPLFKHECHFLFPSYFGYLIGKKKEKKGKVFGPDDQIVEVQA